MEPYKEFRIGLDSTATDDDLPENQPFDRSEIDKIDRPVQESGKFTLYLDNQASIQYRATRYRHIHIAACPEMPLGSGGLDDYQPIPVPRGEMRADLLYGFLRV